MSVIVTGLPFLYRWVYFSFLDSSSSCSKVEAH
jgi:hypothetical protein